VNLFGIILQNYNPSPSVKKRLTILLSHAILYIVPLFEEALYLRTPTGELLNSGSPGFFYDFLKFLILKK